MIAVVNPSIYRKHKVIPLLPLAVKRSLKNESSLVSVANCVTSLKYWTEISWLYIFTNADSWSDVWRMQSSPTCKLDRDLSRCLHLLIAYQKWLPELIASNILTLLRFKYLDIFTTFLFPELSTKNDSIPFPFDDNDHALSKYKLIALRWTWISIISKDTFCLSTLLNNKLNSIFWTANQCNQ